MADHHTQDEAPIRFETHPSRYRHWKLDFPAVYGGRVARLAMDVQEDGGLRPGYPLKLNSYDLGVDIELSDAIQRLRFEHPDVRALVVTSAKDRIFCSGANIYMLGSSSRAARTRAPTCVSSGRGDGVVIAAHYSASFICGQALNCLRGGRPCGRSSLPWIRPRSRPTPAATTTGSSPSPATSRR